jgi:hypothetical protein
MAKRVTSVASRTWCLDRHGFGQCLGAVEVEARENPSWLAAMINQAIKPHKEAGYTSAVVTLGPELAKTGCNRAGPYTSRHDNAPEREAQLLKLIPCRPARFC